MSLINRPPDRRPRPRWRWPNCWPKCWTTDRIDVTADFLQMGLDSIVALSVVQAARRRGIELRARLMLDCGTVRELAAAVDSGAGAAVGAVSLDPDRYGEVIPAPIVSWMYEAGNYRRFTQNALVALPPGLSADRLEAVLQALLDRHDMLRAVLSEGLPAPTLCTRPPGSVRAAEVLHRVDAHVQDTVSAESLAALDRIDPKAGSMIQAVWFTGGDSLLLCVHHLATDVVSWYVILSDLAQIAADLDAGETPTLAAEYTTYRQWTRLLAERAHTDEVATQRHYWSGLLAAPTRCWAPGCPTRPPTRGRSLRLTDVATDVATTRRILDALDRAAIDVRDFLLAALTLTLTSWRAAKGRPVEHGALIALEGHGREDALLGRPPTPRRRSAGSRRCSRCASARITRRCRHRPPRSRHRARPAEIGGRRRRGRTQWGLDYGLLRYHRPDPDLAAAPHPRSSSTTSAAMT